MAWDYFEEIALGNELGTPASVISKWQKPIKVYRIDSESDFLAQELTKIVFELNQLMESTDIQIVASSQDANLMIYTGKASRFAQSYAPHLRKLIEQNRGLFYVEKNLRSEILKGWVFVDTEHIQDEKTLKHLLREELTQALGLPSDSYHYPQSIFYQKWSDVNTYAPIDRQLIRWLYSSQIKAGMHPQAVKTKLQKNFSSPVYLREKLINP